MIADFLLVGKQEVVALWAAAWWFLGLTALLAAGQDWAGPASDQGTWFFLGAGATALLRTARKGYQHLATHLETGRQAVLCLVLDVKLDGVPSPTWGWGGGTTIFFFFPSSIPCSYLSYLIKLLSIQHLLTLGPEPQTLHKELRLAGAGGSIAEQGRWSKAEAGAKGVCGWVKVWLFTPLLHDENLYIDFRGLFVAQQMKNSCAMWGKEDL